MPLLVAILIRAQMIRYKRIWAAWVGQDNDRLPVTDGPAIGGQVTGGQVTGGQVTGGQARSAANSSYPIGVVEAKPS